MFTAPILLQLLWTGLAMSSAYCLFAVAFALVLKVNQVWNFAQPALFVAAYYTMFAAWQWLHLPTVAGLALALVFTVAVAMALEWCGFRIFRLRRSASLTYFIFTMVVSQLAVSLAELFFGTDNKTLTDTVMSPIHLVGPVAISEWDMIAIATTVVLVAALWFVMTCTRLGKQMTAVADNPELASIYGINVARCYLHAMVLAAVLMVAGAWLIGTKAPMVPSSPLNQFLIFAVIAALLAGIGRVFAAGVAAVVLSLIQAFSILVIPSRWQIMVVYVLIVVCVLLFPQGVRRKARRKPLPPLPSSAANPATSATLAAPAAANANLPVTTP
ncbi:MAG: branched-chain amino acid ABC transporter permease [Haliea sp.]|nr:MAG: branched-chain amino acid ABC transporter permease [Haliea sp.]